MFEVHSEMVASVWKLLVKVGDEVHPETVIAVLESMKMEIPVEAGTSGIIESMHVDEGESIEEDQLIAIIREQ